MVLEFYCFFFFYSLKVGLTVFETFFGFLGLKCFNRFDQFVKVFGV